MKYKFLSSQRIIKVSPRLQNSNSSIIYANPEDKPKVIFKDLVVENKPECDENHEIYSWFEDGDVITQKFKLIEKE